MSTPQEALSAYIARKIAEDPSNSIEAVEATRPSFDAIENITVNDGAPYGAHDGYRYSEWPRTAEFFAEHVGASAMRAEDAPALAEIARSLSANVPPF